MSIDLRLRHDRSTRERAAEMFESGLGYRSVARALGVPAEAVRDWLGKYRATGRDGLDQVPPAVRGLVLGGGH